MKKGIVLLLSLLLLCAASLALADVAIDKDHFPDDTFRDFVSKQYGTGGTLKDETIAKTKEMDCSNKSIGSLEGIQNFTALTRLNCGGNNLTNLDCVGKLTALTELDFSENYQLTNSDFTKSLTNLVRLNCSNTGLEDLAGITGMTKLQELHCEYCQLGSLDFSKCGELTYLCCKYNLMNTVDVSKCTKLTYLDCQWSKVVTLNVNNLPALKEIHCNNNDLPTIDFSGCTALETFDATQNSDVTTMTLTGCKALPSVSYDEEGWGIKLSTLDATNCSGLKELYCSGGQVQSVIVSGCTALEKLSVPLCHLDNGIDVTGCPSLKEFDCHWTNVSSLDLSKCPKMEKLSIYVCGIDDVDISNCPKLCEIVQKYQRQSTSDYDYYGEADNPSILLSSDQTLSGAGEGLGRIPLSGAKIAAIGDCEYTGEAITPKLKVTLAGKTLTLNTDYIVSYQHNKKIGMATATVTGKGKYDGSLNASFRIVPKKVALSSLKAGEKRLTVKWQKGSGIDGYEIECSLKKSFRNAKKITVRQPKTTEYEIGKLKAKKTYYVRIRAFKKVNGKKYVSAWSKVLKKKTK